MGGVQGGGGDSGTPCLSYYFASLSPIRESPTPAYDLQDYLTLHAYYPSRYGIGLWRVWRLFPEVPQAILRGQRLVLMPRLAFDPSGLRLEPLGLAEILGYAILLLRGKAKEAENRFVNLLVIRVKRVD